MTELGAAKAWWNDAIGQQGVDQKVQTTLYHDTDAGALQGIVEKGEIWFTSMFRLNDLTELKYGWHIAQEVLQEHFGEDDDRLRREEQRLRRGLEQQVINHRLVVPGDPGDHRRQGSRPCDGTGPGAVRLPSPRAIAVPPRPGTSGNADCDSCSTGSACTGRRRTVPHSLAVRQALMADITLSWSMLIWPALAARHATP